MMHMTQAGLQPCGSLVAGLLAVSIGVRETLFVSIALGVVGIGVLLASPIRGLKRRPLNIGDANRRKWLNEIDEPENHHEAAGHLLVWRIRCAIDDVAQALRGRGTYDPQHPLRGPPRLDQSGPGSLTRERNPNNPGADYPTRRDPGLELPGQFRRDPADRLIVALARRLNCELITVDQRIAEYPYVRSIS